MRFVFNRDRNVIVEHSIPAKSSSHRYGSPQIAMPSSRENKLRLTLGAEEITTLTDEAIVRMTAVGDEVHQLCCCGILWKIA